MRLIPVLAAAGLLAAGAAASAADAVRVAIVPIVVYSDATDSGYVSRGIADMISSRIEQEAGLHAVRVAGAERATSELGAALALGREVEADFVLFGAFTQFGDGASLDLHCAPALADPGRAEAARRIFIQSGAMGEIIPKLDEIVDRVAVYVRGGDVGDDDPAEARRRRASEDAELRELAERVEALERRVFAAPEPESAAAAETEPLPGSCALPAGAGAALAFAPARSGRCSSVG